MILAVRGSWLFKFTLLIVIIFLESSGHAQTNLVKGVAGSKNKRKVYFWTGNINSKIPVFMWVTIRDSIIQGEVTYSKTKNKAPIKLIGQIERDGQIRVCEYLTNGTISGIFHFNKIDNSATGFWYSTAKETKLSFELSSKDTLLANIDTSFQSEVITGDYAYMYGKEGSQGGISIRKVSSDKISFSIGCVTNAPARNLAEVKLDTVSLANNGFVYKLRNSKDCSFQVKFYKNFLLICYLKDYGDCGDFFGLNATVDGIFYKVPSKK
jgi:hypothetical protein